MRMSSNTAALVAMVINLGAYSTEIVRAGVEAIPRRADRGRDGRSGLRRFQIVRFIILFPALKAVYPALTSQFILVLLGSSIVSAIAAEELTAVANTINSQTFRSFEIYTIVTAPLRSDRVRLPCHVHIDLRAHLREARMTTRGPGLLRTFTLHEVWLLLLAARWTIALAFAAFVCGGTVGLVRRHRPRLALPGAALCSRPATSSSCRPSRA